MGWSDQAKQAQKILGSKGSIPDPNADIIKANKHVGDLFAELDDERNTLTDLLNRMEKYLNYFQDQLKKFRASVDKDNLGLNPKDKDDAKKIDEAKAILLGWIDGQTTT